MKQLVSPSNISINGNAVTLNGVNVPLSQILLVADATTGTVLYSIGGPAPQGYTQNTNSIITLNTAPGSSDALAVYYDDGIASTNAPTTVSISNFPATQPVSGTVGITGTVPVSGTFWPTTQPVSGTVTANVQGGNSTAVKVDGSSVTQPISGTVGITGTVPVSGTIGVSSLPAASSSSNSTFSSTSSATVVTASSTTKAISLFYGGTGTAYLLFGNAAASSTVYSFYMVQGDLVSINGYTGQINGLVTTGSLQASVLS